MNVRQHPIIRFRVAGEGHARRVAYGAVGAVAAEQPGSMDRFLAAIDVPSLASYRFRAFAEGNQLDLAFAESFHAPPPEHEIPDRLAVAEQGNAEHRPGLASP